MAAALHTLGLGAWGLRLPVAATAGALVWSAEAGSPSVWPHSPAVAFLMADAIRGGNVRSLMFAGLIAGLELQANYAMLFWMVGLAVGLVLTPERRLLLRPDFLIGAALEGAIALPSLVWQ